MLKRTKIPQDQSLPFLGNLLELDKSEGMISNFERMAEKHGEIYRMDFPSSTVLIVSSHRLINELCDETRFRKKLTTPLEIIRDFAKDGLFTAYGDEPNWHKAHRILTPTFGPMSIRAMFPQMLDIAEQLMLKWERMGDNAVFDVPDDMTRLTLDTIALCAFNYRFNSFYRDEMHPFVHAMVEGLVEAGEKAKRLPLQDNVMFWVRKKYESNIEYMNRVADTIIQKRKGDGLEEAPDDLLNKMLVGKDPVTGEKLTDENIRYQMITFLIAGHETTSGLLSFALYYLSKHPEILAKAQAEVDEVLGNKRPKVEDINQLSYISQILKETLRLSPTAPVFAVEPIEDTMLGDKYAVKKGEIILVLLPALHKDPLVWGEDAALFKPARFSTENFKKLPPNAWKPFGNGARACIGRPFAIQEAILVLSMILQRFEIESDDPNYELKIKETLTLKPENFYLRAKRRNRIIEDETPSVERKQSSSQDEPLEEVENPQLVVLYGSNSGSSRNFALQLVHNVTKKGFTAKMGELDAYVDQIPKDSKVVIITASYEGQPTNDAKNFVQWLKKNSTIDLKGLAYTVFGCGNKDWANTYQAIPIFLDQRLQELGATRFFERGEADAKADFLGNFERWEEALLNVLEQTLEHSKNPNNRGQQLAVEMIKTPSKLQHLKQKQLKEGRILANKELVDMTHELGRSKRHIEIQLTNGMTYQAGDYLTILPFNTTDNVARVLKHFLIAPDTKIILKDQSQTALLPLGYPVAVGEVLTHYVELGQPVTRQQLETLVDKTPCPPERMELEKWLQKDIYTKEVFEKRVSLIDVLQRIGSCSLTFDEFLGMLPAMKPRQYSISSSPVVDPSICSLTVAVVAAPAWCGQGNYQGVASNYLASLNIGDAVWIAITPSKQAFHLPENIQTPVIMVGAGSGIAPFRGFIQERAEQIAAEKMLLFFGCDHPDVDFLYKEELMVWQERGIVDVCPAYTYQVDNGIKYVQDRVWKEKDQIWETLKEGAVVYVCGDGKYMAPAVRATFVQIYKEQMSAKQEEAEKWMDQLIETGQYVLDTF